MFPPPLRDGYRQQNHHGSMRWILHTWGTCGGAMYSIVVFCKNFQNSKVQIPVKSMEILGNLFSYSTRAVLHELGQFRSSTPLKINMEHNHGGLVQIIFLSFHGWFVGSMLIFQGVSTDVKIYVYIWRKHPSKNTDTSHPLVDSSTSELHDVRTAGTKSALELQGNHMRPPDSVRLDSRVTTCGRGQSMLMA